MSELRKGDVILLRDRFVVLVSDAETCQHGVRVRLRNLYQPFEDWTELLLSPDQDRKVFIVRDLLLSQHHQTTDTPSRGSVMSMRWRRVRVGSYRYQFWNGTEWIGPERAWTIKLEEGVWCVRDELSRVRGHTETLEDAQRLVANL
jgi:hypothetical protein